MNSGNAFPAPLPAETRWQAKQLFLAGLSTRAVAVQKGLSENTVRAWCRREKWKQERTHARTQAAALTSHNDSHPAAPGPHAPLPMTGQADRSPCTRCSKNPVGTVAREAERSPKARVVSAAEWHQWILSRVAIGQAQAQERLRQGGSEEERRERMMLATRRRGVQCYW
ncbi:MAG: terminase gpP N-terminus-related DNA-binding protein [Limisphaerales bacterium]